MAQIEYDESGATFSYFLLSAYVFLLIPVTYLLWPSSSDAKPEDDAEGSRTCQCEGCVRKLHKKDTKKPREKWLKRIRYLCIAIGWILFIYMFYRTFTMEIENVEYDPYEILEISRGAEMSEIRRQYRQLSLRYHPDKDTGNQDKFMKIAKAYEALTDEESRKNWEEYGNPDGPRATSFGIALPSWIVSQESSIWVLVVYVGVFMVALPTAVGVWWYRSIKYSSANVLMDTQKLYSYCLSRKASIDVKTLLMILTSAYEFSSRHGNKIKDRPTDDAVLSNIITTSLPHCNMKVQQPPFSLPHARKARALLHSHLAHVMLPRELSEDLQHILVTCPMLLQEMVSVLSQFFILLTMYPRKGMKPPAVETFENVMKLSAIIIQGLTENQSPLFQLPHITPEQLKHFKTKKRHINSLEEFAALPKAQRRKLVKTLTDTEYHNVIAVLNNYPHLEVTVETRVLDDEEQGKITAGSVVTIVVKITRSTLLDHHGNEDLVEQEDPVEVENIPNTEDDKVAKTTTHKAWEKQKRRKKGSSSTKTTTKNKVKKKPGKQDQPVEKPKESDSEHSEREEPNNVVRKRLVTKETPTVQQDDSDADDHHSDEDEEEKEWQELQKDMKQKNINKNYQTASWPVHAPHYPEEKQEMWWVYVCDRKKRTMVACPDRVTGLRDNQEVQQQFPAPNKPGVYQYNVVVRSDSYVDSVVDQPLKFKVHEAQEVKTDHDQYKELEEEEAEQEAFEDSDDAVDDVTDSDDSMSE
ncbi:translocation protein SEC63 homolog isoform X2 [Dysidea avara]|uniref:translocation protein SEC63 homolog isoform X2 n=1 Tax=Dysidea avara TaxID=196820 RepID=UPI00331867D2